MSAEPAFTAEAGAYLADCAAYPWLDPKYHPTEAGAVKLITHRTSDEEDQIKATFRSVAPAIAAPGPPDRAALIPFAIAGEDPDDIPA